MASNQQIISDLRVAQETGHTLELMTNFKGVPFVAKAQVSGVEDNLAHFHTSHPSLIIISPGDTVRLLGSDYFEPASGVVESLDLASGHLVLKNFIYLGQHLGDRMILRVEPAAPYPVTMVGQVTSTCQLADISMSGLGLSFDLAQYDSSLKPGAAVSVSVQLPKTEIMAQGHVLSAARKGDTYRLSVRFVADYPDKVNVFHYLIDRRGEIEDELRQAFEQRLGQLNVRQP